MWRWVLDRAVEQWLCKLNVCVWSFCLFECFCLLVEYIVLIFSCVANISACVKVFVSLNETMATCKHWFVLVLMWSSTCVELLRLDKLTFLLSEDGGWRCLSSSTMIILLSSLFFQIPFFPLRLYLSFSLLKASVWFSSIARLLSLPLPCTFLLPCCCAVLPHASF